MRQEWRVLLLYFCLAVRLLSGEQAKPLCKLLCLRFQTMSFRVGQADYEFWGRGAISIG